VDSVFWRYWEGRLIRARRERWMTGLIEEVRAGRLKPSAGSALAAFAAHHDLQGLLLPAQVAAVEMLNVLRPVVAVSVFIVQAAHALHEHPECREKCIAGGDEYRECFSQEVRRHYPFFPAVAARVKQDFEWRGYQFPRGIRVILGLYATNHDPDLWESPDQFRPERFGDWNEDPYGFIPQGGGDRERDHRCPGDRVSVELIKEAVRFFTEEIRYDVPPQDLRLTMRNMPALPRSRFLVANVRAAVVVA
jgi:fatty-acid peroxygenase